MLQHGILAKKGVTQMDFYKLFFTFHTGRRSRLPRAKTMPKAATVLSSQSLSQSLSLSHEVNSPTNQASAHKSLWQCSFWKSDYCVFRRRRGWCESGVKHTTERPGSRCTDSPVCGTCFPICSLNSTPRFLFSLCY